MQNFDRTIDYFPVIKLRIRDQFIQNWSETIHTMKQIDYLCKFKTEFKFEDYLIDISNNDISKKILDG